MPWMGGLFSALWERFGATLVASGVEPTQVCAREADKVASAESSVAAVVDTLRAEASLLEATADKFCVAPVADMNDAEARGVFQCKRERALH